MSEKTVKKIRRQLKKNNKQVFYDFVVEVSVMPFFQRFWFCLKMAFCMQPLQHHLKNEIESRRKYNPDGTPKERPFNIIVAIAIFTLFFPVFISAIILNSPWCFIPVVLYIAVLIFCALDDKI